MDTFLLIIITEFIISILHQQTSANTDARRLFDDLLRKNKYSKLIRPVGNSSEKLTVRMGLSLTQIIDVDEKNEIISTNVWVHQEWDDYSLRWNPAEYGNVKSLYIPSETLWLPDIVLYNNADGDFNVTTLTKATLTWDGKITWVPPAIYKSQCDIDVRYFPFDEQTCKLKFSVWSYDGTKIDLQHIWIDDPEDTTEIERGIDVNSYYASTEWDLLAVPAKKNIEYYTCCPEPYPDITFRIRIKRKTLFYIQNLVIPMVSVSFITVLGFYLPPDSGERISLSLSVLLSLSMFQLLLFDQLPGTSTTVPLIGNFITLTMAMVIVSAFTSVMILNVTYRSTTHKMNSLVRKIFFVVLAKILRMHDTDEARKKKFEIKNEMNDEEVSFDWSNPSSDLSNFTNPYRKHLRRMSTRDHRPKNSNSYESYDVTSKFITSETNMEKFCDACARRNIAKYPPSARKALDGAVFVTKHLKEEDESNKIKDDWKFVALVIDRIMLIIYILVCLLGSLGMYLMPPTLYDNTVPIKGL